VAQAAAGQAGQAAADQAAVGAQASTAQLAKLDIKEPPVLKEKRDAVH